MSSNAVGVPVVAWFVVMILIATGFAAAAFVINLIIRKRSQNPFAVGAFFFGGLLIGTLLFLFLVFFLRSSVKPVSTVVMLQPQPPGRIEPGLVPESFGPDQPGMAVGSAPSNGMMNPDPNAISTIQQPSPPTEWMSSDLKAFDADVYPGLVQAAAPLGRQVRAKLEANRLLQNNSTGDGFIEPQQVIIAANLVAPEFRLSATEKFSEEISKQFGTSSISTTDSSVDSIFGNIVVLRIDSQNAQRANAPWDNQFIAVSNGTLLCEARTQIGQANITVKYVEKPWVESFGTFTMERPNKQFLAGYSTSLALSEADAKREAMSDASEKLRQSGFTHFPIAESLACDRFVQKLSRPYGDVWRVAFLFDLSSPMLAHHAIATDHARSTVAVRSRLSILAIVALFLITIVLCVVLNLLTLGYYRKQLSFGWAALLLGIVVIGGLVLIG